MSEKDIEIVTLADSKLQIFSPPSNISQTKNFIPLTPNLIRNPMDFNNPERTNFIFSSKIEYLGSGGFSKVYKYRGDIENKAVKKIIADPKYYSKALTAVDSIKREVYGMTKIKCENSLKVYGVFQNKEKNTFFILMELCDGNIEKYIKDRGYPLNIDELLILLTQLNKAFHLLDTNNIIHRDIKPSNILYKEEKDIKAQKYKIKRLFGGSKLVFKLGDYGVCLPLYKQNFSKSQFMGTMDFMAPEIYKMKTEKEHPTYTKKIDLFSLGQSILCLMGFIKKAEPLTEELVEDLKNKCNLFNGKKKEKLLADLIFGHLLIFDPEKRDDWNKYLKHPFFDQENLSYNYFENENKSYADKNLDRITKRIIIRNIKDTNKNKNNEPKNSNNSNFKDKYSKKNLDVNKILMKKKQVSDKKEERKNKEINADKVNKKSYVINKNNTNTIITLKQKGYLKSANLNNKSPKNSGGNLGVKYNTNIKSDFMLRDRNNVKNKRNKITLLDNDNINNKKSDNKSIKQATNNIINLNKTNKASKSNKSNKNILNARNKIIKITNFDNKNNKTSKSNKYSLTAGQNNIIPSNRYSTGKLNRVNMINNINMPFDLRNFNVEKKKTFDYQKIKKLLAKNKSCDNNYIMNQRYSNNNISLENLNEMLDNNNRKTNYMDGNIKIINFYDTLNNYDSHNLRKSTSNYNTNITNINFDSIRNRYKFIHFLQKQRNRNSDDISDISVSQDNSIRKQKSVMVNSRYGNKNNNDIKKTSTIKFMNYNNNCKIHKSDYNSYYNNHIINKSINLSQIQSYKKSINNTFHENNQKKIIKQKIETKKPKFIYLGEKKDKKLKCICGCEDNLDHLKFNYSPDSKFYKMEKNNSYNNIRKAGNHNRSAINDKKEKYNNYNKKEKGKNNYYINNKSIELKEGLKRSKNTDFYYSKYSKTKNNI